MFGKNRSKLFHSSSLTINETRLERSIPISTSLSWPVSNVSSTCANVDLLLSCYLIVRRRCWEMFSFCRPNLRLHMMSKGFKSKGLIIWKRGSPVDGLGHLLRFELC